METGHRYEKAEYYVERLIAVMPDRTEGIPEARSNSKTATCEVDGLSFAAVLEMPDYALTLPVYGSWDTKKLSVVPCLFSGRADNDDLIFGSTSDKDLFPFVKQIFIDDRIVFIDMTGGAVHLLHHKYSARKICRQRYTYKRGR